jgi:flagellar biosynthesis/type III secretory pathway protein FliH
LTFARIVRAAAAFEAKPVEMPGSAAEPLATVVPAPVVDAALRARQIVATAERQASELTNAARAECDALRLRAEEAGRAAAAAELAARFLQLSRLEADIDLRARDRSIELARLLAERLLGEALRLEPGHVIALAEHAIAEARGARRITIVAHPDDAAELERTLGAGELGRVTQVVASSERGRGSLRLETELGVLDAELAPQLDRLTEALRASLRHEP